MWMAEKEQLEGRLRIEEEKKRQKSKTNQKLDAIEQKILATMTKIWLIFQPLFEPVPTLRREWSHAWQSTKSSKNPEPCISALQWSSRSRDGSQT